MDREGRVGGGNAREAISPSGRGRGFRAVDTGEKAERGAREFRGEGEGSTFFPAQGEAESGPGDEGRKGTPGGGGGPELLPLPSRGLVDIFGIGF